MSALAFDTYAAVKKLKEAGFTEQQAEAQTALLTDVPLQVRTTWRTILPNSLVEVCHDCNDGQRSPR